MSFANSLYAFIKSDDIKNIGITALIFNIICIILSISLCAYFKSVFILILSILFLIPVINSIFLYFGAKQFIYYPDDIYEYRLSKFKSLAVVINSIILAALCLYCLLNINSNNLQSKDVLNSCMAAVVLILEELFLKRKRPLSKFILFDSYLKYLKEFNTLIVSILIWGGIFYQFGNTMQHLIMYFTAFMIFAFCVYTSKNLKSELLNLLDRILPEELQYDIIALLSENYNSYCEFKSIKAAALNNRIIIELDLILPDDYTIAKVIELEKILKTTLEKQYANINVKIHPLPCKKDCKLSALDACPIKQKTFSNESK